MSQKHELRLVRHSISFATPLCAYHFLYDWCILISINIPNHAYFMSELQTIFVVYSYNLN